MHIVNSSTSDISLYTPSIQSALESRAFESWWVVAWGGGSLAGQQLHYRAVFQQNVPG